ncbi:MAG TPA: hypothetical protein VHH33_01010 [Nitrososphaeraceae archaeon]|jgi:hypothetical protein|nr:hypothetical protein [Nitrososphaeraceae archaeon]
MRKINLAIIVAFSICLALHVSIPHHSVFGQVNNTNETLILNDNMSTGKSSNTTRIMENTSGMIDDAFDALKDSFGSFFGK